MYYRSMDKTPAEVLLLQELNAYRKNGCEIFLNGRPASPERIAYACVREQQPFMRDFISDETETIRKINFIRVRAERDGKDQKIKTAASAKRK